MHYIILDLEWNQRRYREPVAKRIVEMPFEIIQIGAVKVDLSNNLLDQVRYSVKPVAYKRMNKVISSLTGISDTDLKNGEPFEEVIEKFKQWCGTDHLMLTWGPGDIPVLENNLAFHELDSSWIGEWMDLQPVFNDQITGDKRQYSVTNSLTLVGEEMGELRAHDALNDALNTYKIFKHLDFDPDTRKPRKLGYNDLFSFAVDHCTVLEDVLYDENNLEMACPICGKRVFFDDPINYADNGYISYGACPSDHEFAEDFQDEKDEDTGVITVTRNIFFLTEQCDAYFNRKLDYY